MRNSLIFRIDVAFAAISVRPLFPETAGHGKGDRVQSRLAELAWALRLPWQHHQGLSTMSLVQAIAAPPQITAALQQASAKTGTDFSYLLKTAMRESSLNCNAKSATSSACGLFQFTEQTWLGTMKQNGSDLGLGDYADKISQDSSGRYVVTDPAARREILALRKDPEVSALMAGAYTSESRDRLEGRLGREVNGGELYIAHFLGAGGASKLISTAEDTPNVPADELFPSAAAANRSIFYDRDGSPRSVAEVYSNLVAKHRNTTGGAGAATASASNVSAGRATGRMAQPLNFQNFSAAISGDADGDSGSSYAPGAGRGGSTVHNLGGRSPLTLTPGVVEILASLDAPDMSENSALQASLDRRSEREDRAERDDNDRRDSRLMLPRGGRALG
jgi:hypothetical protein